MSIHILTLGCNYEGTDFELPDCEKDAVDVADEFKQYAKSVKVLIGSQVTRNSIDAAAAGIKKKYRNGDLVLAAYSGHGTNDVVQGKSVQAIVCNDGSLKYEYELRAILQDLGMAAMLIDCCYSFGLVRGKKQDARYVPVSHCIRRKNVKLPEEMPPRPHALYIACDVKETADSTGHGGAMTIATLQAVHETKGATTFEWLGKRIKQLLPNKEHSQHPQFWCRDKTFARRNIKSFIKAA